MPQPYLWVLTTRSGPPVGCFAPAEGVEMTRNEVSDAIGSRALDVIAQMPSGSFTAHEFVSRAVELEALVNASEIGVMLQYLTDNEVIRKLNTPIGQPARWIACAQSGTG